MRSLGETEPVLKNSNAKAKAKQILELGLANKASDERITAERSQRLAMQEQLVGTVGRVEELGLLPKEQYPTIANDQTGAPIGKSQIANTAETNDLQKNSPIGEFLLPPKQAPVQITESLQGAQIPSKSSVNEWDENDRKAWANLNPEQKKDWVANSNKAPQMAQDRGIEGGAHDAELAE